jgi:signal transduction histidine kinase
MPATDRMPRTRHTIRLRLTLTYGLLFVLSGVVLLAITYALMSLHPPFVSLRGVGSPPTGDVQPTWPPGELAATYVKDLHQAQLRELLVQSGVALAIMSGMSIGLGYVVAGRMLVSLRTVIRKARLISATNLHERLDMSGPPDELKALGDTIDDLLIRLEAAFNAQRRFVANASHELRTPLARQRTLVQVALGDPEATVESLRIAHERSLMVNRQQEELIEALLALARGTAGVHRREPVDLAEVARRVVDSCDAAQRGITVKSVLRNATTGGDPGLVGRLVSNLVDNAIRHNVANGWVTVTTGIAHGRATVTVANTGPPVPGSELGRLFQPFQRIGPKRTSRDGGVGLGLSIVHAIATAHHATVNARPRPEGGLEIRTSFPSPAKP